MEERIEMKKQLKQNVRMEMEKFMKEEEDTMDSLESESSFGTQPTKTKKRVGIYLIFSNNKF